MHFLSQNSAEPICTSQLFVRFRIQLALNEKKNLSILKHSKPQIKAEHLKNSKVIIMQPFGSMHQKVFVAPFSWNF